MIVGEDFAFDITFEVNFIWHAFCIYSNLPEKLVICGGFPFFKGRPSASLLLRVDGDLGVQVRESADQRNIL